MIQLATDPTASRTSYRPAAQGEERAKESTFETKRGRTGHAWPFLSRYAAQPARLDNRETPRTDSGS
ncbi:MAG TPA: hypothetical protein VGA59_14125 [Ramlibacter sp.]|jgi:hypothetical protein